VTVLANLWAWLEALPLAEQIGATWWFPLLESFHVLSSTFIVGSILMVDLRLLNLAGTKYPVTRIIREVIPWTYAASAVSVITGVGMFVTRASRYAEIPAFQIKMALLVLAAVNMAIFHLVSARGISNWDTASSTTSAARFAGACSLLLWVGVMLAGRWVGHLL
jgi:Family of unknown function (DUF6644)